MAKTSAFTKRALISKANSKIVYATAAATFIVIFCGIASKSLASQAGYQNRVIGAKKQALSVIKADIKASTGLVASYRLFVNTQENVIKGSSTGTGDRDGDNGRIILDALPSKYDYPALLTSMEKLVQGQGLTLKGISGTDEELVQVSGGTPNTAPTAVEMPFSLDVEGAYDSIQRLVNALEHSIRPIQIKKIEVSGSEGNMKATIDALTYYQPGKGFTITYGAIR